MQLRRWPGMAALISICLQGGCSEDGRGPRGPYPEEIPSFVEVQGQVTELGFALGRARVEREVGSFSITTSPVTVGEYGACVRAGACHPPAVSTGRCVAANREAPLDGSSFGLSAPDLPVTCVAPEQAAGYCAWIGGTVPSPEQWLLAARGNTVRRWAWGDTYPTCLQHPLATVGTDDDDPATCCPAEGCGTAQVSVRRRTGTQSPGGLQDVLLTRGELLRGGDASFVPSCIARACSVFGIDPAAIDGVAGVSHDGGSAEATPYGFRCVRSEGG